MNNLKAAQRVKDFKEEASGKVKASYVFTQEDKNGNKFEHLGLLDTISTKSLVSEELVEKYKIKTKKDNGQ